MLERDFDAATCHSALYAVDTQPGLEFKDLMYCFSIHYAEGIVMAVWADTYFFVWPQNSNAAVFYNGLSL